MGRKILSSLLRNSTYKIWPQFTYSEDVLLVISVLQFIFVNAALDFLENFQQG